MRSKSQNLTSYRLWDRSIRFPSKCHSVKWLLSFEFCFNSGNLMMWNQPHVATLLACKKMTGCVVWNAAFYFTKIHDHSDQGLPFSPYGRTYPRMSVAWAVLIGIFLFFTLLWWRASFIRRSQLLVKENIVINQSTQRIVAWFDSQQNLQGELFW